MKVDGTTLAAAGLVAVTVAGWGVPSVARIPVDHALVSPEVVVLDRTVGPALGSDHASLLVRVARRPQTRATPRRDR